MAAEARVCGRLLLAVGVDVENMLVLMLPRPGLHYHQRGSC